MTFYGSSAPRHDLERSGGSRPVVGVVASGNHSLFGLLHAVEIGPSHMLSVNIIANRQVPSLVKGNGTKIAQHALAFRFISWR